MSAFDKLTHIGVRVSDMERSKRFYCDVLGFVPCASSVSGAVLAPRVRVHESVERAFERHRSSILRHAAG